VRRSIELKETHEISKLTVDISKNLEWSLRLQNHWLADDDLLRHVTQVMDMLWLEVKVNGFGIHEFLRLQKLV
jgi:hypothetical protein